MHRERGATSSRAPRPWSCPSATVPPTPLRRGRPDGSGVVHGESGPTIEAAGPPSRPGVGRTERSRIDPASGRTPATAPGRGAWRTGSEHRRRVADAAPCPPSTGPATGLPRPQRRRAPPWSARCRASREERRAAPVRAALTRPRPANPGWPGGVRPRQPQPRTEPPGPRPTQRARATHPPRPRRRRQARNQRRR